MFEDFVTGAAKKGTEIIGEQDKQAFQLKLLNAQMEMQLENQKSVIDYQRFTPGTSKFIAEEAGFTDYGGEKFTVPQAGQLLGLQKSKMASASRAMGSQRGMISGKQIKSMVPAGKDLPLLDDQMYPMSMASFSLAAQKAGMGTADQRNQMTGIVAFQRDIDRLRGYYRKYEPSNPLYKTAEEKWADFTKGWSNYRPSDKSGSFTSSRLEEDMRSNILRASSNSEVANMMLSRLSVAVSYTRAMSGARASEQDFLRNLQSIPSYSDDVALQELRFEDLNRNLDSRYEAIAQQAPVLRDLSGKGKEDSKKKAMEELRTALREIR